MPTNEAPRMVKDVLPKGFRRARDYGFLHDSKYDHDEHTGSLKYCNHSPAPHFRPIRPPHIVNYRSLACLNEPEALDERLQIRVMQSFDVYR